MKKIVLIGNPVNHSLSPLLHRFWYEKYGILGQYDALRLEPRELGLFLDRLRAGEFAGANVTLPFKEDMLQEMDFLEICAEKTGAVNTIVVQKNGALKGLNTDPEGFLNNLRNHVPNFNFEKTRALVLGTGGAARAIVYALLGTGVPEIIIAGRARDKRSALVEFFNDPALIAIPWEQKNTAAKSATLVVNASPLGMAGFDPLQIDPNTLAKNTLVYDLVYRPLKTDFMKAAGAREVETLGGLGMLVFQAIPAFEAWFGFRPTYRDEIYAMLAEKIKDG